MTPINFGLTPMGRALRRAVSAVTFLFRDDFTTNESAPITSPRTAEPGPGIATITDSNNIYSIVSNQLLRNDSAVANWSNPRYVAPVQTRASGLAFAFIFNPGVNHNDIIGWLTDPAGGSTKFDCAIYFRNSPTLSVWFWQGAPVTFDNVGLLSASTEVQVFIILGDSGYKLVVGGKVFWVTQETTTASLYAALTCSTFAPTIVDNFRVSQLPAPWDTDYGIATDRLAGARTAGDTFTHEADALIEYEITTLTSSGNISVGFRYVDSTHYWYTRITSSGDISLREWDGSIVVRGTSAGAVSNGSRVVVICEDEVIKVYVDNALKITYSSAASFKTETSGILVSEGTGGSVSDIISWPRTLSGTAKDALDAVADA